MSIWRTLTGFFSILDERHHVGHATLQFETGDPRYPCPLAPEHVV